MGAKAEEKLEISLDELNNYLHAHHSLFMDVDGRGYYLTDANDQYWRVQDTAKLNEKGHFTDCSELVPTVTEFLSLPFGEDGKSISDVFESAAFYESVKAD